MCGNKAVILQRILGASAPLKGAKHVRILDKIMKKNYIIGQLVISLLLLLSVQVFAQQLPNAGFEDWSGATFDGKIQPKDWYPSNVTQLGFKFNFAHREGGHTGQYSLMVQDQALEVAGIGATSPGYAALGQPWAYVPSLTEINKATAGTVGGISWKYRPDSVQVWLKRTGGRVLDEDYYIVYYAWSGTAQGTAYAGKDGSCTEYSRTDEESDIRQAMNGNECHTAQYANQIAEGYWRERKEYKDWTLMTVPIYYLNDAIPTKCNLIFSAGNYPNFRANSGMYAGNSLYIDDVRMIYSSKIQKLYIGNKEWKGFDPNSTEEQIYSLGNVTTIPDIFAVRGAGSFTNTREKVNFIGRRLSESEMTVTKGTIDGTPTTITVTAEDGSSTTTYKIKFVSKPSNNARLASILVNGEPIANFNSYVANQQVELPYGTDETPVVSVVQAEDAQQVTITQPTSVNGTAKVDVIAPDKTTKMTYTVQFSVAKLSDNTLQDILVDGVGLPNFKPTTTTYKVELPLGTTTMPTIEAVSAYKKGEQTIVYTAPDKIDGGQYQIAVSVPGNSITRTYRLNFVVTASTNTLLKDLSVEGYDIGFEPEGTTYYVNLPMGTTELPAITYVPGDKWQTVTVTKGGVDGTTTVVVRAASGAEKTYRIVFKTPKSEISYLNNIYLDGVALAGFDKDVYSYDIPLPLGTKILPTITYEQGDAYQTVDVTTAGLDGTTRITVTAGDGSVTIYQLHFSLTKADDATLKMLFVNGVEVDGFAPNTFEYTVSLPQGTTAVPVVSWTANDEWQTITARQATSVDGEARITVRSQAGTVQTYVINFSVNTSSNTALSMIYLDGTPLMEFSADKTDYTITLPEGVSVIPNITFDKAEAVQKVLILTEGTTVTLRVTAESSATRTYTLSFIIQKSQNAFLKMIYLDGDSLFGFAPEKLSGYSVELTGDCPTITVDKEAGQQVSIFAPNGAGDATIRVQPEQGSANVYVIHFYNTVATNLMLQDIQLDGVSLAEFDAKKIMYDISFTDNLPVVTWTKGAEQQVVTLLQDKNTIRLLVCDGSEKQIYTLNFTQILSSDASLTSISLNGVVMSEYQADKLVYNIQLSAGETYPTIDFVPNHVGQSIVAGWTSETDYTLQVTAQNGSRQTYILHFTREKYTDATLLGISLNDSPLAGFDPNTTTYDIPWTKGVALPEITYTKRNGQNIIVSRTNDLQQQVFVLAEDGSYKNYVLNYIITLSSNAYLRDILLDGVSLAGFVRDQFQYTYELPWRTSIVPIITPISEGEQQTIDVYYSSINHTSTIHVTAADGTTETTYEIAFPVYKSSNVALESVEIEGVDGFVYNSAQTDYIITLPYGTTEAPHLVYKQAEPEQNVQFVDAPVTDTTRIIVTAENGDKRTYRFSYRITESTLPNQLKSLIVNGSNVSLDGLLEVDSAHFELTVDMPYGTTEFNVACVENYAEQTYILQPGGTERPTIITLYPNRGNEHAVTYTIKPNIDQQNPAHLTGISVNGTPLADFDKNRYSYIVPFDTYSTTNPAVTFTTPKGVVTMPLTQNTKTDVINVQSGAYSNQYTLHFYYKNDVIPNGEFTEWTTAVNNNGPKPTHWAVLADTFDEYKAWALDTKYEFGKEVEKEVEKDRIAVHLMTRVGGSGITGTGGYISSFITLGTITGNVQSAGGSSFAAEGNIPFHNTPDILSICYKQTAIKTNNRIIYELNGTKVLYTDTEASAPTEDFMVRDIDISAANTVGIIPNAMNIVLNSFFKEGGSTTDKGADTDMYIDWVRFSYNSKLDSITFGDELLKPQGTEFTFNLLDPEAETQFALNFHGQVSDQAQKVEWSEETKSDGKATRNATITNYAEDGTSTVYTLTVSRPLSDMTTLSSLEVGGTNIFNKDSLEYTIPLGMRDKLPNIYVAAATNKQTIVIIDEGQRTKDKGQKIQIHVTAENGAKKTYTLNFVRTASANTELARLDAEGITFDPATREYTITGNALPIVTFTKKEDAQKVVLTKNQDSGSKSQDIITLAVTAEDGTVGTYTIALDKPEPAPTTGLLSKLALDDIDIEGFNKETFTYTLAQPTTTSFVRDCPTDSVVHTITPDSMMWKVVGSATNTYTVRYPVTRSNNVDLSTILLGGEPIDGFQPVLSDYTIVTDNYLDLNVISSAGQGVALSSAEGKLLVYVTAEDGVQRSEPYSIAFAPELSVVDTLQMIYIDGIALSSFDAQQLTYTVMLPSDNPKTHEPQLPTITYAMGHPQQKVVVEPAALGGITYITVTSEDGNQSKQYELTIEAEPSHNALLNNILINNVPVKGFQPDRYWYSSQIESSEVELLYSSADYFQTVVEKRGADDEYILEVTAQDGVTKHSYSIEVWAQTISNNAYVENILLNGQPFSAYDAKADDFTPKQLYYALNVPLSATTLPDVYVALQEDGQKWQLIHGNDADTIRVTAPDGKTTNDYILSYLRVKSSKTALAMIYLGGEPLQGFNPEVTDYTLTLPVGTVNLPAIDILKGETVQTVDTTWKHVSDVNHQVIIKVTAEDNKTQKQYTIQLIIEQSQADTLAMIYEDGEPMIGFDSHVFYYNRILPSGVRTVPTVSYSEADRWQTITVDTVVASKYQTTYQMTVVAQAGQKNIYTLAYGIQAAAVDTLQMIYVDNKPLEGFAAAVTDYAVVLEDTIMPTITWLEGDNYQQVEQVLNQETKTVSVKVTAENGTIRVYTIQFTQPLSNNVLLNDILIAGTSLTGFDPEVFTYTISLPYGTTGLPMVTYTAGDEKQIIKLSIINYQLSIEVTAEDGTIATYTLTFVVEKSSNALLADILLDGESLEGFNPETAEYTVTFPYGTTELPTITWVTADEQQQVVSTNNNEQLTIITVTAGDGMTMMEYFITFIVEQCSINTLDSIFLNNMLLPEFAPTVNEYTKEYPHGTLESELATIDSVRYVLTDLTSTVEVAIDEQHTITITVTAQDGTPNAYIIRQYIKDPSNAYLANLTIDGVTVNGFSPTTFEYVYELLDGGIMPMIEAVAQDSTADVSYTYGNIGDTTYIYCTALDGTECCYTVHVSYSELNTVAAATGKDVILKHIPGSNQYIAATTRQGVSLMLFNQSGQKVAEYKVPICNPNDVTVVIDSTGQEYLADVNVNSDGAIIDIEHFNTIYYYLFLQNDSQRLDSGKVMLTR